jgi:predicted DCC family thiol-disulfide oxidoreductase YuxK
MSDQLPKIRQEDNIVFFDGVCNLCNSSVDFFIRRDKRKKIKYVSLQSEVGKKILESFGIIQGDIHTVYFLHQGEIFKKSAAVGLILKELGRGYRILGTIIEFLPWWITDTLYDFVAKNRYKWMGKRNTCRVPTESEKELFLG